MIFGFRRYARMYTFHSEEARTRFGNLEIRRLTAGRRACPIRVTPVGADAEAPISGAVLDRPGACNKSFGELLNGPAHRDHETGAGVNVTGAD
jgi:hypothetical protein